MIRLAVTLLVVVQTPSPASAGEPGLPAGVRSFTNRHCLDCHSGDDAEGALDLAKLKSIEDPKAFDRWVRIVDRVRDGEMPPADAIEPESAEVKSFVAAAGHWLETHERDEWQRLGRVRARRLTNLQLERSLHSVLGIDVPLAERMPEEPRDEGFTTISDAQSISHFQLEQHLGIVDVALDEAFRRALSPSDRFLREFDGPGLCRSNPRRRCREPENIDDLAVTWSSGLIFYGRLPVTTAKESGWYRFTVKASAVNRPADHGVWCTVRSGRCVSSAPLLNWVTAFEAEDEPDTWSFDAWLPKGDMLEIRPGDTTIKKARFAGGQVGTGEGGPQKVPGVALHSLVMERIHHEPGDPVIRERLFGDLEVRVGKGREKSTVVTDDPTADAARLMLDFARRAFRRPVDATEIEDFVAFVHDSLDAGTPFVDALRGGYRALLCSPRFLYLQEKPGPLDDHAIASRLSYFLWNAPPDAELTRLADAGRLRGSKVINEQVERMLDGERGRRFVSDFADQWLDLDQIDFTEPDRRLHPTFDIVVQQSMLDETETFLHTMVADDLDVGHVVDSDFTFLNSRLARFYGIEGVTGDDLRRVELRPEYNRGGLLTQGAVLKVTANGTTTSPVLRGVWVSERLLGVEIPPPPAGVPAIEPDIRGAKTIREQLAKHKNDAACASCHVKIDPPGFALENFDPAGRWRTKYPVGNKPNRGPVVDPGFDMPDGRHFDDVAEFRELVLTNRRRLAANVAEKMLAYGTGSPVSFADREAVEAIVEESAKSNHGFRSILQAVVTSPVFLSK